MGVDAVCLKLITTLFSVRTTYAGKKLEHKYGGRAFVTDFNKLTPGAKTSVNQEVFEEYVRVLGKHWTNRWTIASHRKLLQSRFQTRRRREQFMDKLTNNLLVPSTSNLALGLHNKKKQPEEKQSSDQNSNTTTSLGLSLETSPKRQNHSPNRRDAAWKIGARFLAVKTGKDCWMHLTRKYLQIEFPMSQHHNQCFVKPSQVIKAIIVNEAYTTLGPTPAVSRLRI